MSQKGSILTSVVAQVVALLRGDAALVALLTDSQGDLKIWNNVPVGAVPPYLWVLSDEEYDAPRKLGAGHYGRGCTVKVCPVSRHRGTREMDDLGDLVMEALERQPLNIAEFRQAGIVWDETHGPIVMEVEGGLQFLRELVFRASAR